VCGVANIHRVEICCIGSRGIVREFVSVSQVIFTPIVMFVEKIGPHPLISSSAFRCARPTLDEIVVTRIAA
jgi:hypothetical protein